MRYSFSQNTTTVPSVIPHSEQELFQSEAIPKPANWRLNQFVIPVIEVTVVIQVWKAGDPSGLPTRGASQGPPSFKFPLRGYRFQEWKFTTWAGAALHPYFLGRGNKYSNVYNVQRESMLCRLHSYFAKRKLAKYWQRTGWTSNTVEVHFLSSTTEIKTSVWERTLKQRTLSAQPVA